MGDLLIGKAAAWGDFQWRNDACPVPNTAGDQQLAQDQAFRRIQARFLDTATNSAIQGVDSGGHDTTYEFMRMASGFSITDLNGYDAQYDASRLFPGDKMSGIPDAWNPENCSVAWNALLMFNPDFTGDTTNPAEARLHAQAGREVPLAARQRRRRPLGPPVPPGRLRRGAQLVPARQPGQARSRSSIYKGGASGSAVTVYPRGLDRRRDLRRPLRARLRQRLAHRQRPDDQRHQTVVDRRRRADLDRHAEAPGRRAGHDRARPTRRASARTSART